ncbi:hypothetical protein GC197_09970 [bacterium]|nr:hypothetical protein [bacterium]
MDTSNIRKIVEQAVPVGTSAKDVTRQMKEIGFDCELRKNSRFQSHSEMVNGVPRLIYIPNRDFVVCSYVDVYEGYERVNSIEYLLDRDGKVERFAIRSYLKAP